MKRSVIVYLSFLSILYLNGQGLTLDHCQEAVQMYSPIQAMGDIYSESERLSAERILTSRLPYFSLNGQVSYQSEVITFPEIGQVALFPEIPKLQYRLSLDIQQVLYDGGNRKVALVNNAMDRKVNDAQMAVQLYQIKARTNELFFGILLMEKKAEILKSAREELEKREKVLASGVKNGLILSSQLDAFHKQSLNLDQQIEQVAFEAQNLRSMLAQLMGKNQLNDSLVLPTLAEAPILTEAHLRPEYHLFEAQRLQAQNLADQKKQLEKPKIAAFATGGLGQPNPFNFLDTELSPYGMVGLRLSWAPWDWNGKKLEGQMIELQSRRVQIQREQFDLSNKLEKLAEGSKLYQAQSLQKTDLQILELQEKIAKNASAQLDQGVITTADYFSEQNALIQAQLNYAIHQIQAALHKANLKLMNGTL